MIKWCIYSKLCNFTLSDQSVIPYFENPSLVNFFQFLFEIDSNSEENEDDIRSVTPSNIIEVNILLDLY